MKSRRTRPVPVEAKPSKVPLAVLEELGVDVADDEVALDLVNDAAPAADIADAVDTDEAEEPEDVPELDDAGVNLDNDLDEVLMVDDDE